MLKILLIEDTEIKARNIKDFIQSCGCNPKVVTSTRDALVSLNQERYDLVLLDLYIPEEFGDNPSPDNAYSLLDRIKNDRRINKPFTIYGITRFLDIEEADKKFKSYSGNGIISYVENSDAWKAQIRGIIDHLKGLTRMQPQKIPYNYDVAIINAMQLPENNQLKKVLSDNWECINVDGDDSTTYYTTSLRTSSGIDIQVVTAFQHQMASIATSMLTTKVIYNFQPRYLFMTGIAAAVKEEKIGYGDVLVATEVWNAANGKLKEGENGEHLFVPDYRHEQLDSDFENIIEQISLNKDLLHRIFEEYPSDAGKPNTVLSVHKGPMASVPAVIAYKDVIDEMERHDRKLLGIEMESYGLFYAAHNSIKPRPQYVASLKSVSDYATKEKCDKYQEYASYTSAAVLKYIIENYLKFE